MKCIICQSTGFPPPKVQLITYGNRHMPLANLRRDHHDLHHIKFLLQWSVLLFSDLSCPWKIDWGQLRRKMIGVLVMAGPRMWRQMSTEQYLEGCFPSAPTFLWQDPWHKSLDDQTQWRENVPRHEGSWMQRKKDLLWAIEGGYWKNIFK